MQIARPSPSTKSRNADMRRGLTDAGCEPALGTRASVFAGSRSKEAMMKKLMLGVALCALTLSPCLAQTPKAPAASPPPAAQSAASAGQQNNAGKPTVVASQKPDQFLASKFKGTDVLGSDNKKIGDVSDILFDKDGKIEAYVISVGGFLGMGAKEVALAPSSFEVVPGKNGSADQLKLSMNKNEIKQAQNFKAYQPPHPTTTGMGGGPGGMKPAGGLPAPRH
jgi:sporulation protein YlmC with PRC-barrel domain